MITIRTEFFTDVKTPIIAGMEFSNGKTKNNKLHKVGYETTRLYFDTPEKDCLIGEERIKRVIK